MYRDQAQANGTSDSDDGGAGIETSQIVRVAGDDDVSPSPDEDHHGRVGGAAEFSASAGKLVVKRNDLELLGREEPR